MALKIITARDVCASAKRSFRGSPATFYVPIQGTLGFSSDDQWELAEAEQLFIRPGVMSQLRVYVVSPGASEPSSVVLVRNGVDTPLAVSIGIDVAPGSVVEDLANSVPFAAGDKLCWKITAYSSTLAFLGIRMIVARLDDWLP